MTVQFGTAVWRHRTVLPTLYLLGSSFRARHTWEGFEIVVSQNDRTRDSGIEIGREIGCTRGERIIEMYEIRCIMNPFGLHKCLSIFLENNFSKSAVRMIFRQDDFQSG